MKTLTISWGERLFDLYNIAAATGLDAEGCDEEWFSRWLPEQRKGYTDVEITPIPDVEWKKFEEYANT